MPPEGYAQVVSQPKRLIIVDGYSLLFRAFFATRYLSTSDGRPTNALFGFTGMLLSVVQQERPDCILVALDAPGKTFRHTDYAEYKGTRRDTPEELIAQLPVARDLLQALAIPQLELTGFEADDIVGTISKRAEQNGYHTSIITGDLDALQLVDECITVITPGRGVSEVKVYDPAAVEERYGFGPEFVPDYKALVGDTSDNIPGVPGVGEKTASLLIQQFGPIEKIIERMQEVPEKFRKKLEPQLDQMRKSKWLATIVTDAPVEFDFEPYRPTPEQLDTGRAMLESLEMKSMMRRVGTVLGPYAGETSTGSVEVENVTLEIEVIGQSRSTETLEAWLQGRPYALWVDAGTAQPSMFGDEEAGGDVWIAHGAQAMKTSLPAALELFGKDPGRAIVHDGKGLYKQIPPTLVPPRFDALLAGYVLQSGRSSYGLRDLAQGYLEIQAPEKPETQAGALFALEAVMRDRLKKESQTGVLDEIEQPLVPLLAEMEQLGIGMDKSVLFEFSSMLQSRIEETAAKVYELAGRQFLIGSPKQLGEVLFDEMGLPAPKKTKTGYATGAEILSTMAADHPIAAEVLTWRELTKLKSTYADALPRMVSDDGRIHTTYNQAVAATGRLSSNDPNLQNIPIRTELGREIRKAFVAAPGYDLASLDYSQIELRILAHYCKDEPLVDAFQHRVDVHAVTAGLMFGLAPRDVSKEQRRLAKMLNYAVLYGVTDFGLANQLGEGFSVTEAKGLIQQYFERFPKVKAFTDGVVEEARSKGFTTTLRGRRRYFPEIHAANRTERLYAERQAMNAPLQGTAADMIKLAMIDVRKRLGTNGVRMLLQVHDELVFEVQPSSQAELGPIRAAMEGALPLDVPVEVDAKVGANWNQMTAIEV